MLSNYMDVNLTLKRIDLCDLMLACTILSNNPKNKANKWKELHDKLSNILNEFDSKHEI